MTPWRYLLVAGILSLVTGCGPAEVAESSEHRPDLGSIGGKADEVPSWMRPISERFTCGESLVGGFAGRDSAHLYRFQPQADRLARIDFAGSFPWHRGAAVAIYHGEHGSLIELLRNPWDSRVSLAYAPRDTREVVVAVYSLTWDATGPYELSASCPTSTSGKSSR